MKDAMIALGWALVFLVPGGLILWLEPLLWELAGFLLAVGGAIFALVAFSIFAPRLRTSQSSAHAATKTSSSRTAISRMRSEMRNTRLGVHAPEAPFTTESVANTMMLASNPAVISSEPEADHLAHGFPK